MKGSVAELLVSRMCEKARRNMDVRSKTVHRSLNIVDVQFEELLMPVSKRTYNRCEREVSELLHPGNEKDRHCLERSEENCEEHFLFRKERETFCHVSR